MLNVVQLCLAANNILFARKGNHERRYSLTKKLCDKMKEKQRIERARSNYSENKIRKYAATVSETAVFFKGYVPFSQTFFGFRQSRLFEFLCWPEQKSEIKLIHSVAACCSDLLLNFIGSFFLFLCVKLSVFLWINGRKSNSLTSGLYWDSSLEIIRILIQTMANSEDNYEFSSAKKPTNTHIGKRFR